MIDNKKLDTIEKSPEQIIEDIISIFRQSSMEENDIMNSEVIVVSKNGTYTTCPIPFPILKSGDFGMSLFKTFMKQINKEEIHSIVEMAFGYGVVKSFKGEENSKEKFEKLKKEVEAIKDADISESIKSHSECQQYMLVNICKPESVLLNFYDVIRTSNNDATVISNIPVIKEELKYGKNSAITNYFL